MKNIFIYILTLTIFFLSCKDNIPKAIADSRINDFALYDEKGGFHRFSTYNDSRAIVLFVQGNGCPIVRNALTDFNEVVKDYTPEGFTFFMINSNMQDLLKDIRKESKDFDFQVPLLRDNNQLIADKLDIKVTSEIIILNPTTRDIVYRGPLNNRLDYETQKATPTETYLRDALEAILDGKIPVNKANLAKGCRVTRRNYIEKDTLSYTADIAPILKDHCIRCHVDGGVAPWSMTDYNTVMGWSSMIEQVLLSKRMPPWKADPDIGVFSNSFALNPENRRKIVRWINEGMEYGSGEDPLKKFLSEKIKVAETKRIPDTTIFLKKQLIPANGILDYRYQKIKLNFPEGKWLAGVSLIPGNSKVTHHITLASSAKSKIAVNRPQRPKIDNIISGYASGTSKTEMFPEGSGFYLKDGTELIVQTHYTTTGKQEQDTSKIELFYHNEKPRKEYFSLGISLLDFKIEPYKKKTFVLVKDQITEDIYVHGVFPHMHYRGKKMKITASTPNGKTIDLVSVPDYDFNWQILYKLDTPVLLPKNSIIKVEGYFDNSFQNPLNPDPSKEIREGSQSTDEMFIGWVTYTLVSINAPDYGN